VLRNWITSDKAVLACVRQAEFIRTNALKMVLPCLLSVFGLASMLLRPFTMDVLTTVTAWSHLRGTAVVVVVVGTVETPIVVGTSGTEVGRVVADVLPLELLPHALRTTATVTAAMTPAALRTGAP
jgi:hypothetical protein